MIKVKNRRKLIKLFEKNDVQYGFHYPKSINQLDVFKRRFKGQKFHNSEDLANRGISLPINPNIKKKELKKIVNLVNSI